MTHYMIFVRDPEFTAKWQPCNFDIYVFITTQKTLAEEIIKELRLGNPDAEYKIGEVIL